MSNNKIIIPNKNEIKKFGNLKEKKSLYTVSKPKLVEYITPRTEIEVLPPDPVKNLKLGWVVSEVVGTGIYNPRGLTSFEVFSKDNWKDRLKKMINKSEDK